MARNYLRCSFVTLFLHFGIFCGKCESVSIEAVIIKEGGTFVLDCNSSGGRNVSWMVGGELVDRSRILPNGSLYITNVNRTVDEGIYCCRDEDGLSIKKRQLLVASICSVDTPDPRDVVVRDGEEYRWFCTVHCRDHATEIFWTRNGNVVNNTHNQQTLPDGSLHFTNVSEGSSPGEYRCCARNSFGTFCSRRANFFVSKLPLLTIQPHSNVRLGTAARLQCHLPSGIPSHMVSFDWLHNGKVLYPYTERNGNSGHRLSFLPQGIIQISRVLDRDRGIYHCLVRSVNGTVSANVTLLVSDDVPPPSTLMTPSRQWLTLISPTSQDKAVGGSALLECLPTRDNLTISWSRRDGQRICLQDATRPGGSNLLLRRLTLNDSGIYICNITDEKSGHSEEASARLTVYAPPQINKPLPLVKPAKLGMRLVLNCVANGTQLRYMWLINGHPAKHGQRIRLKGDGSSLRINYLRSTDAAVYQCIVANIAGEVIQQTEVRFIVEAPDPPTDVTVSRVTSTSFFVQWSYPKSSSSRGNIISYSVLYYQYPDGEMYVQPTPAKQWNITRDVIPFTWYEVCVLAFTTQSGSDPSAVKKVMTAPDVPKGSPVFFMSNTKLGEVNISLLPMLHTLRQGIILQYFVEYTMDDSQDVEEKAIFAINSSFTIPWLQEGHTYSFRVAVATSVGKGPYSEWRSIVVNHTKSLWRPSAQLEMSNGTSVSVVWERGNSSVDGHWLVVTNKHHEPIGQVRKVDMPISKAIWSNLEPNTDYEIHLATFNQYGDSPCFIIPFSTQSVISTTCPVLPPFIVSSESVKSTSLVLVWSEPVTNLRYDQFLITYQHTQGVERPSEITIRDPTKREYLISDLHPYRNYTFCIGVVCQGGRGEYSKTHTVRTLEDVPASAPESINALPVNDHTVNVMWKPPLKPNGVITDYIVLYNKDHSVPEQEWSQRKTDGKTAESRFSELESGTRYYFKVKAGTQVGFGPTTESVYTKTLDKTDEDPLLSPKQIGILIGVCLAVLCIVLCSILIVCKYNSRDANTHPIRHPPLDMRPSERTHAKHSYTEVLEEDAMSVASRNVAVNGRVRTTFHNSGHYVLHYQGSTNILNPSQESSQSSTSTQSPPLDVLPKGLGSTSSATTDAVCQGLGGSATSSHSSCCRVQPNPWSPHSSQHHSYLHLDPRDECQEGAQSSLLPQRPLPQDPLLQGERCSLLPSVYSQNSSKDRTVKETVV